MSNPKVATKEAKPRLNMALELAFPVCGNWAVPVVAVEILVTVALVVLTVLCDITALD